MVQCANDPDRARPWAPPSSRSTPASRRRCSGRRCADCGYVFFPPHDFGCEACGALPERTEPTVLAGAGVLRSFATVHRHGGPSIEAPFVVGEIALDAGPMVRAVIAGEHRSAHRRPHPRGSGRVRAAAGGGDREAKGRAPVRDGRAEGVEPGDGANAARAAAGPRRRHRPPPLPGGDRNALRGARPHRGARGARRCRSALARRRVGLHRQRAARHGVEPRHAPPPRCERHLDVPGRERVGLGLDRVPAGVPRGGGRHERSGARARDRPARCGGDGAAQDRHPRARRRQDRAGDALRAAGKRATWRQHGVSAEQIAGGGGQEPPQRSQRIRTRSGRRSGASRR